MCEKHSSDAFRAVVKRLQAASSLLAVTHVHPDGDALGSMVGLGRAGEQAGKTVRMLVPDALPQRYRFLLEGLQIAATEQFAELAEQADVVVVLDTCCFSQLGGLAEGIQRCREKVVVVDHHTTRDDVGAVQWIDVSAAAVGAMMAELLEVLGWPVELPVIEALAAAVTSDTGWLRFANTDPRVLRRLASWIEAGLRPDELYRHIYQSDRPEQLRLTARMLESLELHCDEKLAVMTIRAKDFAETGARADEIENLVNEAMRLSSVVAAALLVEQADCVHASLRSREAIDVAQIARRFGGGGHARAAGCRSSDNLDAFKQQLIEACAEALQNRG